MLVFTRLAVASAIFICVALTGPQLIRHVAWDGYANFTSEVTGGRRETGDLLLLSPILQKSGIETCDKLLNTPLVTLHLYANDMLATEAGIAPLQPAEDAAITTLRLRTRELLEQALACSPMDGNLWLSLAIISKALGEPIELTAQFVELSRRYAPYENWIKLRRDMIFLNQ
jgi:hypothetical protein